MAKDFVESDQRSCGISTAAAEAGCKRYPFFQMQHDPIADIGSLKKRFSGAINKIARISWQSWIAASELNCVASALNRQMVIDRYWVHDGFEFVKAVWPPAEDV